MDAVDQSGEVLFVVNVFYRWQEELWRHKYMCTHTHIQTSVQENRLQLSECHESENTSTLPTFLPPNSPTWYHALPNKSGEQLKGRKELFYD